MNKSLRKDLLIFLLIFGVLSLPFIFTNLDIRLEKPYFDKVNGWYLMQMPFWDFIYKYGIFLGYFVAVGALVMVSLSYWKKWALQWRRASFFMLFVMVVGPGALVNGTFKEHWGRPRPREITEFNGTDHYVKVWVKGHTDGKSFPCGHASMGFYLSIPFLFLRKRFKMWAWVFMVFGILYGGLIGYARMIAGGHFASDVLWAAGMVWLTAIPANYLLKVDKIIDVSTLDFAKQKRQGKIVTLLMGLVLPVLTLALLLATPYISKKEFKENRAALDNYNINELKVHFKEGSVQVSFNKDFAINYSVSAFGFPNSKIRWNWNPGPESTFELEHMGWFTEVRNSIKIKFPTHCSWQNTLMVDEGSVFANVPNDTLPAYLKIEIQEGDLTIKVNKDSKVNLSGNFKLNNQSLLTDTSNPDAILNLVINQQKGSVNIIDEEENGK